MDSALGQAASLSLKISLENKQDLQSSYNTNVEVATNCHFTACFVKFCAEERRFFN
jgi:D-arabinose 5-phosphate isomerase GutQ